MNLKSLFDTIESFGIGLAIVLIVIAIVLAVFIIPDFLIVLVPELLKRTVYLLMLIGIFIVVIFLCYFIGRIAKKPLKNKVNKTVSSNENYYCEQCGSKLKEGAKFCDSCGTKVDR